MSSEEINNVPLIQQPVKQSVRSVSIPYGSMFTHVNVVNGVVQYDTPSQKFVRIISTLFVLTVVVCLSSIDFYLWTRVSKPLSKVALIISEIFYPALFTSIIFLFGFFRDIIIGIFTTRLRKKNGSKNFWSSGCNMLFNRTFIKIFIVSALCDALGSVLGVYPVIMLEPILTVFMGNLMPFIIMIMSILYLSKVYYINHWTGSFLLLISVLIYFVASFSNNGTNFSISLSAISWCILLLVSKLPIAFGIVFKERYLKDLNMDVLWTNIGIGIIQTIFSIPLAAVIYIPTPDDIINPSYFNFSEPVNYTSTLKIDNYLEYIGFGYKCLSYDFRVAKSASDFFSHNYNMFIGNYVLSPPNITDPFINLRDVDLILYNPINITGTVTVLNVFCNGIGFQYMLFIITNIFYNVAITKLLKMTTSNITAFVHIFIMICLNALFGIKSIAGPAYHQATLWNLVSLICISGGFIIFCWKPEEILIDPETSKIKIYCDKFAECFFGGISNCITRCRQKPKKFSPIKDLEPEEEEDEDEDDTKIELKGD